MPDISRESDEQIDERRATTETDRPVPQGQRDQMRALPSVDRLTRMASARVDREGGEVSRPALLKAVRRTIEQARTQVLAGHGAPSAQALTETVLDELAHDAQPNLRSVINATGVIINTNLGRAPLSLAAIKALQAVAHGYSNLEFDLAAGSRGSRHAHVRDLLRELTGAEDALVVNNNAAAVLVVLSAIAAGREVIVSRGELVEIGGGFRIPDVLRQSGARLVEVGTTNRTRAADFAAAMGETTAALLSVHPSNFRVIGFTESPDLAQLATLARAAGLPLIHDLGSGALLRSEQFGLAHEPMPQESIAAGADIVCFSGDKLLGGPQAGIIAGRTTYLSQIARHPLMRAVRMDKLTLAALEATLRAYSSGSALAEIPIWRMMSAPAVAMRQRTEGWVAALRSHGIRARAFEGESTVGGGSLPGETLPTWLCGIDCARPQGSGNNTPEAGTVAAQLRGQPVPVIVRVLRDEVLLDPRTVPPGDDADVVAALIRTMGAR